MKRLAVFTALAITAALTSACSKSGTSEKNKPANQAQAPAPATGSGETPVISPTGKETLPPPTRRLVLNNRFKASLGQGVTSEWGTTAKCLEGAVTNVTYEKPSVTYRLRKAVGQTSTGEKRNLLVAEMVVLTQESSLADAQPNEKAHTASQEDFVATCGAGAVMKIYSGVRASKTFALTEEQYAKATEFELAEKDSVSKAKDFAALVAKATEGLQAENDEVKVDGLGQGAVEGAASFEEALDAVRAIAAESDAASIKGRAIEGDVVEYPTELKAKVIPNVFTEEKK